MTSAQRDVVKKMQQGQTLVEFRATKHVKIFDGLRSDTVNNLTLESLLENKIIKRVKTKKSYDTFKLIKDIKLRK
jgi:hypothetical protein